MKTILKKALSLMGYKIKIVHQNSKEIAFLHISKTAGTQIMHIIKQLKKYKIDIKRHDHWVKLSDLPLNTKYFFSIRNPATRFVSGFYFRKAKKNNHTLHEKITFQRYENANDIAEDLFEEGEKGVSARNAIKSINHCAMSQIDWFQRYSYFELHSPITIIRQEHFEKDMQRLIKLLDVNTKISDLITEDKTITHKNNYDQVLALSEKAIANLERWYIQDYMFYEMCETWLKKNNHIN